MNSACLNTVTDKQPVIQSLAVTVNEAAALLGISRSLFYQLQSSGRLNFNFCFLGSKKLIRRQEIVDFVNAGMPPATAWSAMNENKKTGLE